MPHQVPPTSTAELTASKEDPDAKKIADGVVGGDVDPGMKRNHEQALRHNSLPLASLDTGKSDDEWDPDSQVLDHRGRARVMARVAWREGGGGGGGGGGSAGERPRPLAAQLVAAAGGSDGSAQEQVGEEEKESAALKSLGSEHSLGSEL